MLHLVLPKQLLEEDFFKETPGDRLVVKGVPEMIGAQPDVGVVSAPATLVLLQSLGAVVQMRRELPGHLAFFRQHQIRIEDLVLRGIQALCTIRVYKVVFFARGEGGFLMLRVKIQIHLSREALGKGPGISGLRQSIDNALINRSILVTT
jgi:hypothetical protein